MSAAPLLPGVGDTPASPAAAGGACRVSNAAGWASLTPGWLLLCTARSSTVWALGPTTVLDLGMEFISQKEQCDAYERIIECTNAEQ